MVIGAAIKIGNIIIKFSKFAGGGIASGNRIVQTFPPNLRPYVRDVLKGANIVTAGGLIADVLQGEWNEYGSIPQIPRTGKYNQFKQKYSSGRGNNFGRRTKRVCYNRRSRFRSSRNY